MGSSYEKGLYNKLMDVMAKPDAMETEHKQDRQEIRSLTTEATGLQKENHSLRKKVSVLQEETSSLRKKNAELEKENAVLRTDKEGMKRLLGNDCSNSSMPPSAEPPWKASSTCNGRKPTKRSTGAQTGHKGNGLSKSKVEEKIRSGVFRHRIVDIGDPSRAYVTRYVPDMEVQAAATEYRIQGMQIYCGIMSFIETMKRKKENIFQSIAILMSGGPVRI